MDLYGKLFGEGDPRVLHLLFMKSPIHILLLILFYLCVVRIGPQFMNNYKPFKLKPILILYNGGLVFLSTYMFTEALVTSYLSNYNYWCDLVDYSIHPLSLRMANVVWWFFFSKVIELFDTIFIILRKKSNQISFLHVYHHCTVLCLTWTVARYFPGGQGIIGVLLNSFVHIFMYSYYGLSIFGERVKPYLWWKRYLTQMQLIQFLVGVVLMLNTSFQNCQYPKFLTYATLAYVGTLVVLFSNFYIQTYIRKRADRLKMLKPLKVD